MGEWEGSLRWRGGAKEGRGRLGEGFESGGRWRSAWVGRWERGT